MLDWFSNIFGKKKKLSQHIARQSNSLEEEILDSIREIAEHKEQTETEILNIRNWAADAIKNVFYVPSEYWFLEIDSYQTIKTNYHNQNIHRDLAEECDRIVSGYTHQLSLRTEKLALLTNLENQYENTLKQLASTQKAMLSANKQDSIRAKLQQHVTRLLDMEENLGPLSSSIALTEKYKQYIWEVNKMRDDYSRQAEIFDHLKKLDQFLNHEKLNENAVDYRIEIEKLNTQLNKPSTKHSEN